MPTSRSFNTYEKLSKPEFRERVERLLAQFEQEFYAKTANAPAMLKSESVNMELYKRHNIETVLRIALKRAVDPLIANYWATRDPQLCKEWGLYGAEEGRHDRMFARDLHVLGMTDEEIYATKPTFATELLNGYFYYTMATEGPLAAMVSGFYLESVAGKTQPEWLDNIERFIGTEKTKGARSHLANDLEDEHVDMVWNMIMRTITTPEDEERFVGHLIKINSLFVAYFVEVTQAMIARASGQAGSPATAPIAAVTTEVTTARA